MMRRMLISPCAMLICVCSTFAQAPSNAPVDAPKAPIEEVIQPSRDPQIDAPPGTDNRFWAAGDYMYAWMHRASVPPLVTTSPDGTARTSAGVLGAPGTTVLFGGGAGSNPRSAFRLGAGYWFDAEHTIGIEGGFMMAESQARLFSAASGGSPILARPYVDATTGLPQAVLVAFPGSSSGAVNIRAETGNFYSGNLDLTERICDNGWMRMTTMGGYRFYNYGESLSMQQNIVPTGGAFVPGTNLASADHFGTRNEFHGMDLGLRTEFFWRSLSLEVLTKFAVGNLRTVVSIDGKQLVNVPGSASAGSVGGVYALQSNWGNFANNHWGTLPEFGTTLKWQIRPYLQVRLGYSLLLLDGVARAGNQVKNTISPANFPPAAAPPGGQPSFTLDRSNIWFQSVNLGLTFTY